MPLARRIDAVQHDLGRGVRGQPEQRPARPDGDVHAAGLLAATGARRSQLLALDERDGVDAALLEVLCGQGRVSRHAIDAKGSDAADARCRGR